ncbi:hypothetical protein [Pseudomonas sp. BJa3]|uniref:hypothetical protein n=1 Tax=Pseudomonas sp. BJa3 TaxID=2986525 RepID=UPI0022657F83|nr:hypothetical protein [Pseudomonas sp. BJa3]MCX5511294.1 hypothetical protein [Pseudomonas sp. BJa3]
MNQSIDLEAAKAAFFSSGGRIIVLEGFQYVPFRQRHHPEPKPKRAKPVKQEPGGERKHRAQARAAQIAELAKTMTCGEVAKLLGETKTALWGGSGAGRIQVLQPAEAGQASEGEGRAQQGGPRPGRQNHCPA